MAMNNGGPAFPQNDLSAYGMGPCEVGNDGMSLRDWFAGQALAAVLTEVWGNLRRGSAELEGPGTVFDLAADASYQVADAMLAARQSDAEGEG